MELAATGRVQDDEPSDDGVKQRREGASPSHGVQDDGPCNDDAIAGSTARQ